MKPAVKEFFTEFELAVMKCIAIAEPDSQTFQTLHHTIMTNDPQSEWSVFDVINVLSELEEQELLESDASKTVKIVHRGTEHNARVYSLTSVGQNMLDIMFKKMP